MDRVLKICYTVASGKDQLNAVMHIGHWCIFYGSLNIETFNLPVLFSYSKAFGLEKVNALMKGHYKLCRAVTKYHS